MTRYSRSVMPGRAAEAQDPALDRMVFGAKRPITRPTANDPQPDFLPPVDDEEVEILVQRSNSDRRAGADRRQGGGRRKSEYAPLREPGRATHHAGEDNRRGPLLLAGALLIVIVFGVVVWNAYSDGIQGEGEESAPELTTAGAFKTPPRVLAEAPIVAEPPLEVPDEPLAGAPANATEEERPEPAPVEAAAAPAPAPSKFTAPPPAPLKPPVAATPVQAAPVQTAAAQSAPAKPVAATPAPATPVPAPAAATAVKPAFATGNHLVQIAATSSEASAATEWSRLQRAHPDLLSGAERFIQQADVGGRTVYRLRVGSFASKADAVAFCAAFKAQGGNCLPAVK